MDKEHLRMIQDKRKKFKINFRNRQIAEKNNVQTYFFYLNNEYVGVARCD